MSLMIIKNTQEDKIMDINPQFQFEDASREQSKASIMIEGLSGEGKSGLALIIAKVLAGTWEEVFDIDTENRSIKLFAGIPSTLGEVFGKFKIGNLTKDIGFSPTNYLAFREAAIASGAKAVIEDSISHAWQYSGGVLDLVTQAQTKMTNKNDKYGAWRDPIVQKEKNDLLELIRDPRVHVITTVRVKEKFVPGTDADGKNIIKSLGEQQIQQDDLKFEPDLVLHMETPGNAQGKLVHPTATIIKTRYAIFTKGETYEFTPELLMQLKAYLEIGADPAELLQKQHEDYVQAITEYLNGNPNAVTIWKIIKKDSGFEKEKLPEIPLTALKPMFLKLTT